MTAEALLNWGPNHEAIWEPCNNVRGKKFLGISSLFVGRCQIGTCDHPKWALWTTSQISASQKISSATLLWTLPSFIYRELSKPPEKQLSPQGHKGNKFREILEPATCIWELALRIRWDDVSDYAPHDHSAVVLTTAFSPSGMSTFGVKQWWQAWYEVQFRWCRKPTAVKGSASYPPIWYLATKGCIIL